MTPRESVFMQFCNDANWPNTLSHMRPLPKGIFLSPAFELSEANGMLN